MTRRVTIHDVETLEREIAQLKGNILKIGEELNAAENTNETVTMLEALLERHGEGHHQMSNIYPCHVQQAIFAIKARDRGNDRRADILRAEIDKLRNR